MAFNKTKVMNVARKHVSKGNWEKAIKEYLRVVEGDPKDVRVWLKLADLYAKQGSKDQACDTYQKVAKIYSEQGFYLKAVAVYKQILKVDPRLIEMNLKLAELYRQLGLKSDAVQHFENVAAHFHREGKVDEALATVRQLVEIDPDNVATRIKLAELYSKQEMTEEAVTEFQIACEQLKGQNRENDYLKVAERLLWHKPEDIDLAKELATTYLRQKDAKRAIPKLQLCFKADQRDPETLGLLAEAFDAMEQTAKTVSVLKELAKVHQEKGDAAQESKVYKRILTLDPSDADALAKTGGAVAPSPAATAEAPMPTAEDNLAAMSVPEVTATQDLEQIIVDDGDFGTGQSSVAGEAHSEEIDRILKETDVYIKYGLHQKALGHLTRIFELDPQNPEGRERKKEILIEMGNISEAVDELVSLADLVAASDSPRAESYLREALSLDPAGENAREIAMKWQIDIGHVEPVDIDSSGHDQVAEFAPGGDREYAAGAEPEFDPDEARAFDAELRAASSQPVAAPNYPIPEDLLDDGEAHRVTPSPENFVQQEHALEPEIIEEPVEVIPDPDPQEAAAFDAALPDIPDPDPQDAKLFDSSLPHESAFESAPDLSDLEIGPGSGESFVSDSPLTDNVEGIIEELEDSEIDESEIVRQETQLAVVDEISVQAPPELFEEVLEEEVVEEVIFEEDVIDAQRAQTSDTATAQSPVQASAFDGESSEIDAAIAEVLGDADLQDDEFEFEFSQAGADSGVKEWEGADENPPTGIADDLEAPGVSDDLEEVDFFISQQLFDEARDILTGLLAVHGGHPAIQRKVQELEQLVASAGASTVTNEDDNLSEEEVAQHYDLGLAYKDMGLYDEAIKAFSKAAVYSPREADSRLMIGLCYKAEGNIDQAIEEFESALDSATLTEMQRLNLQYELAGSYEEKDDATSALEYFDRVMQQDKNFLDAAQRAEQLRSRS